MYHKLSGLNNRNLLPHSCGSWKYEIQVSTASIFPRVVRKNLRHAFLLVSGGLMAIQVEILSRQLEVQERMGFSWHNHFKRLLSDWQSSGIWDTNVNYRRHAWLHNKPPNSASFRLNGKSLIFVMSIFPCFQGKWLQVRPKKWILISPSQ